MTSCTSKRMKLSEGMDDRISNLPIEIIDRILDNMPVRDATRTTILSRKWRNFWPMHPKLVLDQHSLRVNRIDKVINKILLQRTGLVLKFLLDLSCINSSKYSDVDQWLIFLSRNGLKKLALLYSETPAKPYRFPSYVFSCPSLKHMALHNVVIKPFSSRSLDNLTFLSFKNVGVESNSSEVFSSPRNPQLKKLSIERCVGIVHLEIVAPLLEVLRIYFSYGVRINSLLNPNLKEFNFNSLGKGETKKHGFDLLSGLFAKLSNIRVLLFDGFFLKGR
ncbi:F-box/FBD/LRR-repeat protein At1g13570-like [Olea europaea var. sylvestris]|uniref:F-box/FBD/LRR-repeat protein At1g13570-like n=1 Tax=Olea europaea var. sylvestris TaxID=158386 RepID=UPI000C1D3B72|nr:F-box/FBD/LRR-repeat protein At1g13570-like [Olea europaea var. sylvestris]